MVVRAVPRAHPLHTRLTEQLLSLQNGRKTKRKSKSRMKKEKKKERKRKNLNLN
jgi:hypothetical protein